MPINGYLDLDLVRKQLEEPYPSGRMTLQELGDTLAQLVWESFSDFVADPQHRTLLSRLGIPLEGGVPGERITEELLILHMWAHSRAVQLSFFRRVPGEQIKVGLDHLHRGVFEDMVENGTPKAQIPVFEQRVSARYAEYYAAARHSDQTVGMVALDHLVEAGASGSPEAARALTDRAVEVAEPLRDFLEGVDLIASDPPSSPN